MPLAEIPEILRVPPKLMPLIERFNDYRYFLLYGGRGGAKSQTVARFLLYLADRYPKLRIVCGRETQNTLAESSYTLLSDLIQKHDLSFDVQASKITAKTDSVFSFRGMREAGAFNIQGMENVSIVFIDEAQAITKRTLDVLLPTIRAEEAKIIFCMNRYQVNDPVYERFISRSDCLSISINYNENPFCTEALKKEALECLRLNPKDYAHIWLGEPIEQGDNAVFSFAELEAAKKLDFPIQDGYYEKVAGFDIARFGDDKCAGVGFQQCDMNRWRLSYLAEWAKSDLNYTTGQILRITNEQQFEKVAVDEDGLGSGPLDTLQHGRQDDRFLGFRNVKLSQDEDKDFANMRTRYAFKLKELISKGYISLAIGEAPLVDALILELCSLKYTFDSSQRRILISKDKMRSEGIKSPNLADAAIYATSQILEMKETQERPLQQSYRQPQYAVEPNWFDVR